MRGKMQFVLSAIWTSDDAIWGVPFRETKQLQN